MENVATSTELHGVEGRYGVQVETTFSQELLSFTSSPTGIFQSHEGAECNTRWASNKPVWLFFPDYPPGFLAVTLERKVPRCAVRLSGSQIKCLLPKNSEVAAAMVGSSDDVAFHHTFP